MNRGTVVPVSCDCGRVQGTLSGGAVVKRCVCYCLDCQAFARFLEREDEMLNEKGGTEVIQTTPDNLVFTEGAENLACMRLTPKGLLRWYAKCCGTPVGNTPPNWKMPFVGLVHNCLGHEGSSLSDIFGPVRTHAFTASARDETKAQAAGVVAGLARSLVQMLKVRFSGRYRQNPFFELETGVPVAVPRVLSDRELEALKIGRDKQS